MIDEKEFLDNKLTFQTIDVDHSGSIDKDELKKALECVKDEDDDDVEAIIEAIDFNHSG